MEDLSKRPPIPTEEEAAAPPEEMESESEGSAAPSAESSDEEDDDKATVSPTKAAVSADDSDDEPLTPAPRKRRSVCGDQNGGREGVYPAHLLSFVLVPFLRFLAFFKLFLSRVSRMYLFRLPFSLYLFLRTCSFWTILSLLSLSSFSLSILFSPALFSLASLSPCLFPFSLSLLSLFSIFPFSCSFPFLSPRS